MHDIVYKLREAERALYNISDKLNSTEYMKEWNKLEAELRAVQLEACHVIYEATKHVNSLDTILMVYKDRIDSTTLAGFVLEAVKN